MPVVELGAFPGPKLLSRQLSVTDVPFLTEERFNDAGKDGSPLRASRSGRAKTRVLLERHQGKGDCACAMIGCSAFHFSTGPLPPSRIIHGQDVAGRLFSRWGAYRFMRVDFR